MYAAAFIEIATPRTRGYSTEIYLSDDMCVQCIDD